MFKSPLSFLVGIIILASPGVAEALTFRIISPDNGSGMATSSQLRLRGVVGSPIMYGNATNGTITNKIPFRPPTNNVTPPPPPPLPLDNIKVIAYPNPFRPHMGDQGVQFLNLQPQATIRLLTIMGEEVLTLYTDDTGKVFWDGRNNRGEEVASGIYLVFIKEGTLTRVIKIGVER